MLCFQIDGFCFVNNSLNSSSTSSPTKSKIVVDVVDVTGRYRLYSSENFDQLLQTIGIGFLNRLAATRATPDYVITSTIVAASIISTNTSNNPINISNSGSFLPLTHNDITNLQQHTQYTLQTVTMFRQSSITFISGVEFIETRIDGLKVRSVIDVKENNKDLDKDNKQKKINLGNKNNNKNNIIMIWTHIQYSKPLVKIVRQFSPIEIKVITTCLGVTSVRKYRKLAHYTN